MTEPKPRVHGRPAAWRHCGAVLILLGVTLVFFTGLLQGRTYSDVSRFQETAYPWGAPTAPPPDARLRHLDQAKSYYPWQVFISRSLRGGEVPLWNPYSFAGTPFLAANGNNALYPPRVALSLTVSPMRVHDLLVSTHMFIAGLAMYFLLVYLRVSFAGALLGGVAWMASSFMIAWLALEHFVVVAALLPLAVLLADASIRRRSWAATIGLGIVLALLFLGANLLFVELCFAAVGTYAAALILARMVRSVREPELRRGSRDVGGDIARFAVPWLLFAALSAFILLPTAVLVASSSRSPLPYLDLQRFALPRSELRRLFTPPNYLNDAAFHANAYHSALFGGTVVTLLAIVGLGARRSGAWFARVLALVTLFVALGTPVLALPYLLLPGFDNLKPLGRVLFLFAFALAILAAFGLDTVSRTIEQRIGGRRGVLATTLIGIAAIGVTIGQLRVYAPNLMRHQEPSASEAYPATPLVRQLQRDGNARFLAAGGVFPGSTALVYPLRNAIGYESVVPARVQDFWRVVEGLPPNRLSEPLQWAFEPAPWLGLVRTDLLWRAGVGYLVAPPAGAGGELTAVDRTRLELIYEDGDGRVFQVRNALPRAYVVGRCVAAEDSRFALVRFHESDFDPRRTVILERDELRDAGIACASTVASRLGRARIVDESVNELTVEVNASSRGFLVLNETWDPGWRATVDGRKTPVLPANSTFRAIPVDAGRHTVELSYRPRSYELGVFVSVGTVVIVLVVLAGLAVRRRSGMTNEPMRDSISAAGMTSKSPGANP